MKSHVSGAPAPPLSAAEVPGNAQWRRPGPSKMNPARAGLLFAFVALAALVAVAVTGGSVHAAGSAIATSSTWYDGHWPYRQAVHVSHPGDSGPVSDYQVQIKLDSSFDFAHDLPNGHDLRVTSDDGTTLIPFWIESWDAAAKSASVWVKVPTIPDAGTTIYLYYGNSVATSPSAPSAVPVPPTGPFTKAADNPQQIPDWPCGDTKTPQLLPENMVESGGIYYLVVSDRQCDGGSIGLLSASSPSGPWTFAGRILTQGEMIQQGDSRSQLDAPNLVQVGGDWYLFYSHFYPGNGYWNDTDMPAPIGLAKSTSGILGPYTEIDPIVLSTGSTGAWDDARVSEPYVIQKANGDWVMVYMADADSQGGYTEQVGIATSTHGIEGPYVKSAANPVLAFGPSGSLDAGTIADPWVVEFEHTYYIGYTASPTKAGWNTTYATTTDWSTFTKSNTVILPQGGSYDSQSAFRGAVTRFGDTYYFPYTSQDGSGFHFSMATQPAVGVPPSPIDNPDAVFKFYDGFDGSSLDTAKWDTASRGTPGGLATVSGGQLTLTAPADGSSVNIQELVAKSGFGPGGVMLEALARHDTAIPADGKSAGEVGLGTADFNPSLRIADYDSPFFVKNVTNNGIGGGTWPVMAHSLDADSYVLHRIGWAQPGSVEFSLANDSPETIADNIPTQPLPPWLAAVALGRTTTLSVDWVRVRSWVGAEAAATLGAVEASAPVITVPADITAEATSPDGAMVSYSAAATSAVDPQPAVSCLPASGSTFPLGTTTVHCTASDAYGNSGTASFHVTVQDTTPPAITVPSDITTEATGPAGAAVSYTASPTDAVGVTSFSCTPASGSTFPIGKTTVTCTAADAHGNTASAAFTVTVTKAASSAVLDQLAILRGQVVAANLKNGTTQSISAQLDNAKSSLAIGDTSGAKRSLDQFVKKVNQNTPPITAAQANAWIASANSISAAIGS